MHRIKGPGPMAAAALLALAATHASAGDGYGEPRPAAPSWHGFYVGAAAGHGVGESALRLVPFNMRGAQGVLTVGYDFQLSPRWVAGLFADYAFGEVSNDVSALPINIDNQLSIGGRLGVLATPSTLLYASSGYTGADFSASSARFLLDTRLDGFFVGLGIEQVLKRNLSLKLDYRYSDYGVTSIYLRNWFGP